MLKKITVLGGETVVNVVDECNGMLMVNSGTFYTIYGIEWQGKRNVQHVGEFKYIQNLWRNRYRNIGGTSVARYAAMDCVPRVRMENEYIPE